MLKKIVAIIFIYCCTTTAWMILGSTVNFRTNSQEGHLRSAVGELWGKPQKQRAPLVYYLVARNRNVETKTGDVTVSEIRTDLENHYFPLDASNIDVQLHLDYRRKGLLWYSTYRVGFHGKYRITNPLDQPQEIFIDFAFPGQGAVYDQFQFRVGGWEVQNIQIETGGLTRSVQLNPGESSEVEINYASQGMDEWWYEFGSSVTQVRNFDLSMTTDFGEINFPENSISPTEKHTKGSGWNLKWQYSNLLSGVTIGMGMPKKLNPGPWVSKVIYAAPVSLFLFFFLLFIFSVLKDVKVHPMNYFFLGASFFSFHLLLAYLVDHISIHVAFLISSLVSILLVVSYMRLVVGSRFAFLEVGLSQFVYLVLFGYTFFFEEYTGLAVTILCVLTLFVVMQFTGRLQWDSVFGRARVQPIARDMLCPYCRNALESATMTRCLQCGTPHHAACWTEHGGCAIFGCVPQHG